MKRFNILRKPGWILITIVLMGSLAFAFPASNVSAAPLSQEGDPPQADNPGSGRLPRKIILERIYQRELHLLNHVDSDLGRIDRISERVEILIDKLQDQGVDTTEIENALADFIRKADSASAPRDEAARILAEHAGFDDQGQVVKVKDAIETVRQAGENLRQAHRIFHEALREMKEIIRSLVEPYQPLRPALEQGSGQPAPERQRLLP